jgi:hypothetical protein
MVRRSFHSFFSGVIPGFGFSDFHVPALNMSERLRILGTELKLNASALGV